MSPLFKDVQLGFSTYFKSFSFISKNRLWHFMIYPVILILALGFASFMGISSINDTVTPWIYDMLSLEPIPGEGWWDKTLNFFKNMGQYAISFILSVLLFFIYYKISKYIVLIFMSPIMAFLSEKTDKILTGRDFPFAFGQFIKDILRGVMIALRNMMLELALLALIGIVSLLISFLAAPLAAIILPVLSIASFLLGAYFYGFSTMDYTSERRKLSVKESILFIRKNKGIALANGTIFTLWLIIPFFGTYVGAVLAPITCTVGATLAIHEKVNLKNDDFLLDDYKKS